MGFSARIGKRYSRHSFSCLYSGGLFRKFTVLLSLLACIGKLTFSFSGLPLMMSMPRSSEIFLRLCALPSRRFVVFHRRWFAIFWAGVFV